MRLSHFWVLLNEQFGDAYASSLAQSHVLGALGGRTCVEALDDGMPPRTVWLALCDDMDVPESQRLGKDVKPAR